MHPYTQFIYPYIQTHNPSINPEIQTHNLSINPSIHPFKQTIHQSIHQSIHSNTQSINLCIPSIKTSMYIYRRTIYLCIYSSRHTDTQSIQTYRRISLLIHKSIHSGTQSDYPSIDPYTHTHNLSIRNSSHTNYLSTHLCKYVDTQFTHPSILQSINSDSQTQSIFDCGIVVREVVLQSRYYVHFRANTLGKGMNPLILPAMG